MRIAVVRIPSLSVWAACVLPVLSGCVATDPAGDLLADPLKQRLLAREDIALQNLLLARSPSYSYAGGGGGSSYLDEPYDGPAIEPPLPDLNLLPEDMPPWDEAAPESADPDPVPMEADPAPSPTPMEPVPTETAPASAPTSESVPAAEPSPSPATPLAP